MRRRHDAAVAAVGRWLDVLVTSSDPVAAAAWLPFRNPFFGAIGLCCCWFILQWSDALLDEMIMSPTLQM